jgi:heme O synthase-like polyprenyltransferase
MMMKNATHLTQANPIRSINAIWGLAFRVATTLISFYLMVTFVNFLAALLTLTGIIYYVLL